MAALVGPARIGSNVTFHGEAGTHVSCEYTVRFATVRRRIFERNPWIPRRQQQTENFFATQRRRTPAYRSGYSPNHGDGKERETPQPSLADQCRCLQHCFYEICVENMGRPAGTALHEFVRTAVNAYLAGHTRDKLSLQLAYRDSGMEEFILETEGFRLTASEERYRSQWLDTVHITLQILQMVNDQASRSSPATADVDSHLFRVVKRVIDGQRSGDEQSLVKFDRGLATKGASGGAVAAKEAIAPQFIPLTQLVLLTMKVVNEEY
ncbi:hypothetical protein R1flu_016431 [Riccia fluitans]|uniref:Uncharacterized protein n=1 Tax=Riccia fluitans TaxID=41844 RepID=A0ABD1YM16_9MARC